LYLPKWTDEIMGEVSRNLAGNFGLSEKQLTYRESEMRRHFPEAWVHGYDDLVPAMTNHPKDRHVLAAAVKCNAGLIVTLNMKDFPRTALQRYSIGAAGPSTFLRDLYELDPEAVSKCIERQAASISKPADYVLERLSVNAPGFVRFLRSAGRSGR